MKANDFGIFLHRSAYSSSSLIVTCYTLKKGLQRFIFKGGKKKAQNLFPMSHVELTFYGRNPELLNLTNVESVTPQSFQFHPVRSSIAFFMAEVIHKCVHEGDNDPDLFHFFSKYSNALNNQESLQVFPVKFLIDLSEKLGFKPLNEINDAHVFNLDAGVFQHTHSSLERTFSGDGVQLIIELLDKNAMDKVPVKQTRAEALTVYLNYFSIHSPRFQKLESYEILKEVLNA
tara:strand:- start:1942 stop:2634 length:693 start_codon:yes stop_codon:yes gene_type:complete